MIHLDRSIVVEGKYDKIKLSSFIGSPIITTDGFGIFKNKQKISLIKALAIKNGIIIMTDSDGAGLVIRNFLKGIIEPERIINVYIPEILGKEKRKTVPSSSGLLGVEGVSKAVIEHALKNAGVFSDKKPAGHITKQDFYELGLTGAKNSSQKRKELLLKFDLPTNLSVNDMISALNQLYSEREFKKMIT